MRQKGFTLVELLLVISLMAISVGVTSDILLSLIRSYNKTQIQNELEQTSSFISQKLENEIRNASDVSVSSNSLTIITKSNERILYVVNTDANTFTREYTPAGGVSQGAETLIDLSRGIDLTCTLGVNCFKVFQAYDPEIIMYSIGFYSNTGSRSFAGTILMENVVVLRNTYNE